MNKMTFQGESITPEGELFLLFAGQSASQQRPTSVRLTPLETYNLLEDYESYLDTALHLNFNDLTYITTPNDKTPSRDCRIAQILCQQPAENASIQIAPSQIGLYLLKEHPQKDVILQIPYQELATAYRAGIAQTSPSKEPEKPAQAPSRPQRSIPKNEGERPMPTSFSLAF